SRRIADQVTAGGSSRSREISRSTHRLTPFGPVLMPFEIDISNHQSVLPLPTDVLRQSLLTALHAEQVASAVLSISIVDNATIHRLNREHLQHDYPTDVISFALEMLDADDGDDWGDWDEDD